MKNLNIVRHGDLILKQIKELPQDLKETKTKILLKGSHEHNHSIDKGKVYLKNVDKFVFGYLVAEDTKLFHDEHSPKGAELENGIYELRRQVEYTHAGMKQVVD